MRIHDAIHHHDPIPGDVLQMIIQRKRMVVDLPEQKGHRTERSVSLQILLIKLYFSKHGIAATIVDVFPA